MYAYVCVCVRACWMRVPMAHTYAYACSCTYAGIEEVGVQVEQPFEILPMTQLCNLIMANLEEAFDAPAAV